MRPTSAVFIAIAMTITAVANAQQQRTEEQILADLMKAARVSVATYRATGMSGLIGKSKDCYKRLSKFKYYCVYLDLAARRIDQLGGAGTRFPPTEYFDDVQFGERTEEIFLRSSMNREQANEYLSDVAPVVNKFVDEEARKKLY